MTIESTIISEPKSTDQTCFHCNEKLISKLLTDEKNNLFCCHGCLTVHQILQENNLSEFYEIREQFEEKKIKINQYTDQSHFEYLDQLEFQKEHIKVTQNGHYIFSFYLENVHCFACLWLIEKMPKILNEVISCKLDMSRNIVEVEILPQGKFSVVAQKFQQLGYTPHPLINKTLEKELAKKEERTQLIRIAISAAVTMNIMLFTVSIYAGANLFWAKNFGLISLLLSLPAIFYSALPFYHSAYSALKSKNINLDVPISLAIISGFLFSCFFIYRESHHHYFDSLSALIFLLLCSRYILKKAQDKALDTNQISLFFSQSSVHRWNQREQTYEEVHEKFLSENDIIKVLPGEIFPADGVIQKGSTKINQSLLNGESRPIQAEIYSQVYAGTENISHDVIVLVQKLNKQTRIGKILKEVEQDQKSKAPLHYLSDKISKYFVTSVIIISLLLAVVGSILWGIEEAITRALALLIITCPCALGLATPLTFARGLNLATKHGLIIKNPALFEKVLEIKNIIFDKTGTLTYGFFNVISIKYYPSNKITSQDEQLSLLYALEKKSQHSIAKSLTHYLEMNYPHLNFSLPIKEYEEIRGIGVTGRYNGAQYSVKASFSDSMETSIGLYQNQNLLLSIELEDQLREESSNIVQKLYQMNYLLTLCSGDKKNCVHKIVKSLKTPFKHIYSEFSPEKKNQLLSTIPHSLMIGDGANDAMALSKATIGIAVNGSLNISLKASDVYFSKQGLTPLMDLIKISQSIVRTVRINLTFSLSYNLIAGALSILGYVNPLIAAILMPISSLSVIFISLFGTRSTKVVH